MNIVKNRLPYELKVIAKEISKGGLSVQFLQGQNDIQYRYPEGNLYICEQSPTNPAD